MAHVNGGYVITTRTKNIESEHDVDQKTLQRIAELLGVKMWAHRPNPLEPSLSMVSHEMSAPKKKE
jgi:hypothetical protein